MPNTFTGKTIIIPHWPVAGYPITAQFGRVNPKLWPHPWGHPGTDIGCPVGTPVQVVFDGKIEAAGSELNFGNRIWVISPHPEYEKIRTLYAHNSKLIVLTGKVTAGQLIAYSGATGVNRQGKKVPPHCHNQYEISPTRELLKPLLQAA